MQKIIIPIAHNPLSHQHGVRAHGGFGRGTGIHKTKEFKLFQHQVSTFARIEFNRHKMTLIESPYAMHLTIYCVNRRRGDWTNMTKTVEDAMIGIFFKDDKLCEEAHVYIKYDKFNPRIEAMFAPIS